MFKKSLLIVCLVMVGLSCKKLFKPEWSLEGTIPLGYGKWNLSNILLDSLLGEDSSGLVYLKINQNILTLPLDTFMKTPDTTIVKMFSIPLSQLNISPGMNLYAETTNIKLSGSAGSEVDYLNMEKGSLNLTLSSSIAEKIIVEISLPGASYAGVPLSQQIALQGGSQANPVKKSVAIDLRAVEANLTGSSGDEHSQLAVYYSVKVAADANPFTLYNSDFIEIALSFSGVQANKVRGYFGQHLSSETITESFDIFKAFRGGNIDLPEGTLKLIVENGLGIDCRANIGYLRFQMQDNSWSDMNSLWFGSDIWINRALESGNPNHPVYASRRVIDLSNSNAFSLLENFPKATSFAIDLELNPLGNVAVNADFIDINYGFSTSMELSMPFKIGALGLVLVDTIALDTNSLRDIPDYIQEISLDAELTNGFPFGATLELNVQDSEGNFSLKLEGDHQNIAPGETDMSGIVQRATQSRMVFTIDREQLDLLQSTGLVLAKFILDTPSGGVFGFYSNNNASVRIVLDTKMTLNED